MVDAAACRFCSGNFSTFINCVTMLLTSRPLPMPAEEMVGEMLLVAIVVRYWLKWGAVGPLSAVSAKRGACFSKSPKVWRAASNQKKGPLGHGPRMS